MISEGWRPARDGRFGDLVLDAPQVTREIDVQIQHASRMSAAKRPAGCPPLARCEKKRSDWHCVQMPATSICSDGTPASISACRLASHRSSRRSANSQGRSAKAVDHVLADLVAARADGRPDAGHEVARIRPERLAKRLDRGAGGAHRAAAPAGMDRADDVAPRDRPAALAYSRHSAAGASLSRRAR